MPTRFEVVDSHSDLAMTLLWRGHLGDRVSLRHRWLPQLREGGVTVQVAALYVEADVPEAALRRVLQMAGELYREVEENASDAAICRDAREIDGAVAAGKVAFVLALEGAMALGADPSLVRVFHELGVRMISFTHFGRTLLADGSAEGTGSRLTAAGVDTLKEMERLGVLMDVSHLNDAGVEHVLELATRPVVASHSSSRTLVGHHRNLTDEHMRGIAATGGMAGVNLFPYFLAGAGATVDHAVDHVEHMVEVMGDTAVGIGADFVREIFEDSYPRHANPLGSLTDLDGWTVVEGLYAPNHYQNLAEAMLRRGWTERQVAGVMGGNYREFFRRAWPAP